MNDRRDRPSREPPIGADATNEPGAVAPVMVEATRGGTVECRHRGAAAVVDASGHLLTRWGDIERPVFPRSAAKPLQALALMESGAADACRATEGEIALACGSHTGSARHVGAVKAWLKRMELTDADLECGAHPPRDAKESQRLALAGEEPGPLHNNYSGKHASLLALARHIGAPTKGYVSFSHPVQQRVLGALEVMTGTELTSAPRAIDGCGVPTIAVPAHPSGVRARAPRRPRVPERRAREPLPTHPRGDGLRARNGGGSRPLGDGDDPRYRGPGVGQDRGRGRVRRRPARMGCGRRPQD